MLIGARYGSDGSAIQTSECFAGMLDEVAVFDYPLSDSQIAGLIPDSILQRLKDKSKRIVTRSPNGRITITTDASPQNKAVVSIFALNGGRLTSFESTQKTATADLGSYNASYFVEVKTRSKVLWELCLPMFVK